MSKILLTQRDRALLSTLSDFGLMSTDQIRKKMFIGIHLINSGTTDYPEIAQRLFDGRGEGHRSRMPLGDHRDPFGGKTP